VLSPASSQDPGSSRNAGKHKFNGRDLSLAYLPVTLLEELAEARGDGPAALQLRRKQTKSLEDCQALLQ
jgi:hypothetical protein